MRKLRDLIRKWWTAPRWRLALACLLLALMSSCYHPPPRAKTRRAALCDYCMIAAGSNPEWVRSCDGGCDEIV